MKRGEAICRTAKFTNFTRASKVNKAKPTCSTITEQTN